MIIHIETLECKVNLYVLFSSHFVLKKKRVQSQTYRFTQSRETENGKIDNLRQKRIRSEIFLSSNIFFKIHIL